MPKPKLFLTGKMVVKGGDLEESEVP